MTEGELHAAVAASGLAGDRAQEELLHSVAELAMAIFAAHAASITTYDPESDELIFQTVAGEGEQELVGRRFPAGSGLAGWVLQSREPLVIDDVSKDPRFAADVAEDTGYVPKALIAAPLLRDERSLGVLTILDRPAELGFGVAEMDLLVLFARQASIALDVVERSRAARTALDVEGGDLARTAAALDALEGPRREAASELLAALGRLIAE